MPDTPVKRYAWSRALTSMREHVTEISTARLCIGGKIEGYLGRLPGLIEEPLLSLRARKPLYLVGAIGGCSQLVIDLIEQRTRPEMTTTAAEKHVKDYQAFADCFAQYGGAFPTREQVAKELADYGADGPAAALNNGLDDAENREIFDTTDPRRIAELVCIGVGRLG